MGYSQDAQSAGSIREHLYLQIQVYSYPYLHVNRNVVVRCDNHHIPHTHMKEW